MVSQRTSCLGSPPPLCPSAATVPDGQPFAHSSLSFWVHVPVPSPTLMLGLVRPPHYCQPRCSIFPCKLSQASPPPLHAASNAYNF